jgi:ubiquitin C-terminal hydrolase
LIEFCDLKNEKEDLKLLVLGWKLGREVQEVEIAYELLKGAKSQKLLPPTMKIIRHSHCQCQHTWHYNLIINFRILELEKKNPKTCGHGWNLKWMNFLDELLKNSLLNENGKWCYIWISLDNMGGW